jgi:cation diffusion facilitator family transporter
LSNSSSKAILYAFIANLLISISKSIAAIWTNSGSLMAEAIHSFADAGNQILLYWGLKQSAKPSTDRHPFGYGRESYFWSLLVALILFILGGLFSVKEGWERFYKPHPIENTNIALIVLGLAIIFETISLKKAWEVLSIERKEKSLKEWFMETHSSELIIVLGEDIAALLGLGIAFVCLAFAMITNNPFFDAIGSISIGILLIIISLVLGIRIHSLMMGESNPTLQRRIHDFLISQKSVTNIWKIWAIHNGRDIQIMIKVSFENSMMVKDAVQEINRLESEIKQLDSGIRWIFFELDDKDD